MSKFYASPSRAVLTGSAAVARPARPGHYRLWLNAAAAKWCGRRCCSWRHAASSVTSR